MDTARRSALGTVADTHHHYNNEYRTPIHEAAWLHAKHDHLTENRQTAT